MDKFRLHWLATGGTIAKQYNPHTGVLDVENASVQALINTLTLPDIDLQRQDILALDSLEISSEQRSQIAQAVDQAQPHCDAILITHGTDTMTHTCQVIAQQVSQLTVPIVVTGAMVPYGCVNSDAQANVAQAIVSAKLLKPGIYIVLHGQVLEALKAYKNKQTLTFEAQL